MQFLQWLKYQSLRRRRADYIARIVACTKQMNHDNVFVTLAEIRAILDLKFTVVCKMQDMMAELDVEIDGVTVEMTAHMRNVA
jgi:hypothetical protein